MSTRLLVMCTAALTATAAADFTGVVLEDVGMLAGAPPGSHTVRAYATFSDPNDIIVGVLGSSNFPMRIETDAEGGLLNDCRNLACLRQQDVPFAPFTAAWDSFVTIDALELAESTTQVGPDFFASDGSNAGLTGSVLCSDNVSWFNSSPDKPISAGPDGRVLIAQFTLRDGNVWFEGEVAWRDEGGLVFGGGFQAGPGTPPGAPCDPSPVCVCDLCPADFDQSLDVGITDLVALLSAWGPCSPLQCPYDLDGDEQVGFVDLVALLASWGSCS